MPAATSVKAYVYCFVRSKVPRLPVQPSLYVTNLAGSSQDSPQEPPTAKPIFWGYVSSNYPKVENPRLPRRRTRP